MIDDRVRAREGEASAGCRGGVICVDRRLGEGAGEDVGAVRWYDATGHGDAER